MTASKRPTPRKIAVYLSAIAVLSLADPRPVSFAAGCVFVALAWLLRVWAFGHLEKNELMVTTGPYAHTRNPAYLGSFLALVGVSLAAGNAETTQGRTVWILAAVLAVAFFAFYLPRKFRREYSRLRRLFGDEQVDLHAANVPDFLPRLTPWRSGQERRFSWKLVGENHEWPWGVVLAVVLALVWTAPYWSPLRGLFEAS
jgi:protein-S-isoprenylcysteine O-methyltransferase Ste14